MRLCFRKHPTRQLRYKLIGFSWFLWFILLTDYHFNLLNRAGDSLGFPTCQVQLHHEQSCEGPLLNQRPTTQPTTEWFGRAGLRVAPCHGWCARESSKENGSGRDLDEDWYSLDLWSQCPGKKTSDFRWFKMWQVSVWLVFLYSQVSCASSWSWHTSACFGTRIRRCWCLQHGRTPLSFATLQAWFYQVYPGYLGVTLKNYLGMLWTSHHSNHSIFHPILEHHQMCRKSSKKTCCLGYIWTLWTFPSNLSSPDFLGYLVDTAISCPGIPCWPFNNSLARTEARPWSWGWRVGPGQVYAGKYYLLPWSMVISTPICSRYTLPRTNSSHLKIGLPNRIIIFQPSLFQGLC